MKINKAIFSLLVFIGGCSYGLLSPYVKIAYTQGYTSIPLFFAQYGGGWICLSILVAIYVFYQIIRKSSKHNLHKINWKVKTLTDTPPKQTSPGSKALAESVTDKSADTGNGKLKNILLFCACGLSIVFCSVCNICALNTISVSLTVLLLFQFSWMGIIIQTIISKKAPSKNTLISVGILLLGTLFASGILSDCSEFETIGILFGIGSAVCYASYIFLIGHLDVKMNPIYRGFIVMSVALATLFVIFGPSIPNHAAEFNLGLLHYFLLFGFFSCAIPIFLFAIATPKIPTGLATIISSSELPATIICGVIIVQEYVSVLQWLGVIFVLFGIAYPYIAEKHHEMLAKNQQ